MSYLVLARKYRPQVFDDIVGQEHLIKTLSNAISVERVAHAYLFCGPRGVGKTTAARILAKALNCEKGPTPVPCNACETCLEITGGRSMDVLEIDGASNRGINEVRELRENVRYAPSGGRSKIYIIDEVHMLTTEAFNALLKTLEEPPAHVVFVFATTEPFKVPATILSRVQRFDFARIPARKIAEHLSFIMKEEKIEVAPEALSLVARRAKGGLRDALSLMDQIISAADGGIDREMVERMLGLVGGDFYYSLVDRFAEEDAAGAIKLLDTTYSEGADLGDLAEGLTVHLRDLMLLTIGDDLTTLLDAPESEVPRLKTQASLFTRENLVDLVDRAAEITVALRRSEHPRLTMELALAEMVQVLGCVPLGELAKRLLALEQNLGRAQTESSPEPPAGGAKKPRKESRSQTTSSASKTKALPNGIGELETHFLEALKDKSMSLWSVVQTVESMSFAADGSLVLCPSNAVMAERLVESETQELLENVLLGMGIQKPRVILKSAEKAPETEPAALDPRTKDEESPPEERRTERPKQQEATKAAPPPEAVESKESAPKAKGGPEDGRTMGQIFNDEPMLQKALDMFDGEVLP
jgi:DNA polymerase-3 subunit gamma/tau